MTAVKEVEVVQVVRTTLAPRGRGTDDDPYRRLLQYWSFDGRLLFECEELTSQHYCGECSKQGG